MHLIPRFKTTPEICWLSAILCCTILLLGGCQKETNGSTSDRLAVAVSIGPQAWLVQQIGSEHVQVTTLLRPADSPETFAPSDAQIARVTKCVVYFRIGVPFEQGRWFNAIKNSKLTIVDLRDGITLRRMKAHHHHKQPATTDPKAHDAHSTGSDPHIWLSPPLLKSQAQTIANALIKADPDHKDVYQANLTKLERRLDEADKSIRAKLQPYKGKAVFVFHPAWGYFTDAYHLEQVAVQVEGKEPTDRQLNELKKLARDHMTKVIFVQPQISGKGAQVVAKAIDGRVEVIDPVAIDVIDNLMKVADQIARALKESQAGNHKAHRHE